MIFRPMIAPPHHKDNAQGIHITHQVVVEQQKGLLEEMDKTITKSLKEFEHYNGVSVYKGSGTYHFVDDRDGLFLEVKILIKPKVTIIEKEN